MKILGIDTSSYINTAGLIDGDRILAEVAWEAKNSSLQKIISIIDFTLTSAGLTLEDIEGLAVGIGPGSWTGVRVGVTVGKTFAYIKDIPICGISSLDILAYGARNVSALLCPIIDANRQIVYAALYRPQGDSITQVSEYYVGEITKLLEIIPHNASADEVIFFLGNGASLHRDIIDKTLGPLATYGSQIEDVQRGSIVALLAAHRFDTGESKDSLACLSLAPLYLKESAAQALLTKRESVC